MDIEYLQRRPCQGAPGRLVGHAGLLWQERACKDGRCYGSWRHCCACGRKVVYLPPLFRSCVEPATFSVPITFMQIIVALTRRSRSAADTQPSLPSCSCSQLCYDYVVPALPLSLVWEHGPPAIRTTVRPPLQRDSTPDMNPLTDSMRS